MIVMLGTMTTVTELQSFLATFGVILYHCKWKRNEIEEGALLGGKMNYRCWYLKCML
jgi:hypothetical protein